jgi:hypothetical protein
MAIPPDYSHSDTPPFCQKEFATGIISEGGVSPPIFVVTYPDAPVVGRYTSFTLGLSSGTSAGLHPPGKELVISVTSMDPAWGLAVGYVADLARGRFMFAVGETIDFHARIADESAMSGFLIARLSVIDQATMPRVFAGRPITLVQLLPLYLDELQWIREVGSAPFLHAGSRYQIDWHDVLRTDLSRTTPWR